ncbi:MAG: PDZ domain-containing protein, partial [Planctomycetaceae bacterium]|nr:PDZ domain-containing protein [Planctomycetaceae bacterium]
VIEGSPAALSGLRPGDRIVQFAGRVPAEVDDFAKAVMASGETVQLQIERDREPAPRDIIITLRGGPIRLGIQWRTDAAEPESVIVTRVVPGSPAADAGITIGDRISAGDGEENGATGAWLQAIATTPADTLLLRRERDGVVQDLTIRLLAGPLANVPQLAD